MAIRRQAVDKKSEQLLRKLKFIAEAKKNNYPNAGSFAKKMQQFEGEDGQPFGCSARTIARDIRELIKYHGAPLEYDAAQRGYYLRNPAWEFSCPVFEEDFVSMAILGTRLSSDILPQPVKDDIDNAVAQTMASNHSEFFDTAMIESILCASGIKASIDPKIFKALFDAWRQKRAVCLSYRNPKGEISQQKFEPHIIAFNRGAWYTKGYLVDNREIRIYAIQRIMDLQREAQHFETDRKLLEDTRKKGLFTYEKISGIKLHCDASIAFYIYEQQKLFKSKIERQPDDSLVITLNPAIEHEVMRWILGEGGRIQVLEPDWLRKKVADAGKLILEKNS
jgi:predicted DNA-binding transcriptional regulator YafY